MVLTGRCLNTVPAVGTGDLDPCRPATTEEEQTSRSLQTPRPAASCGAGGAQPQQLQGAPVHTPVTPDVGRCLQIGAPVRRTWLWALSSWFSRWHCRRACRSASSAWARWAFSRHFCEYCSERTSSSRCTDCSSSLGRGHCSLLCPRPGAHASKKLRVPSAKPQGRRDPHSRATASRALHLVVSSGHAARWLRPCALTSSRTAPTGGTPLPGSGEASPTHPKTHCVRERSDLGPFLALCQLDPRSKNQSLVTSFSATLRRAGTVEPTPPPAEVSCSRPPAHPPAP